MYLYTYIHTVFPVSGNVKAFEVKRRNVFKKHQGLLTSEWEYAFIGNLCNKMKNVDNINPRL